MSSISGCTVYIGNLDERVSDRVLYDILIQAGRVVDLYVPRDKATDRPKGYAFAEYETEEIADYAVRLFSGLVTLYNRTLKFAISGQDKLPPNVSSSAAAALNSSFGPGPQPLPSNNIEVSPEHARLSTSSRLLAHEVNYAQVPAPRARHQPDGYKSHFDSISYNYSQRVLGATLDSISRSRSNRNDTFNPVGYPSY